jgi:hypothetical protein
MKRLRFLSVFISLLVLTSCDQTDAQKNKKIDLAIPENLPMNRLAEQTEVKDTRMSIVLPKGYVYDKEYVAYRGKGVNTIEFLEKHLNFLRHYSEIMNGIKNDTAASNHTLYMKECYFGSYKAIVTCNEEIKKNVEQLTLAFGDEKSLQSICATYPLHDEATRKEILKALLTVSVDSLKPFNPINPAFFNLDITKSEFRFLRRMREADEYLFSINGVDDLKYNNYLNMVSITVTFVPLQNQDTYDAMCKHGLEYLEKEGWHIDKMEESRNPVNGHLASAASIKGTLNGKPCSCYMYATGYKGQVTLFLGTVFERQDELMGQLKDLASTLQIRKHILTEIPN